MISTIVESVSGAGGGGFSSCTSTILADFSTEIEFSSPPENAWKGRVTVDFICSSLESSFSYKFNHNKLISRTNIDGCKIREAEL